VSLLREGLGKNTGITLVDEVSKSDLSSNERWPWVSQLGQTERYIITWDSCEVHFFQK